MLTVIINYNHSLFIDYIDLLYHAGGNAEKFDISNSNRFNLCVHKYVCLMLSLIARIDVGILVILIW